MCERIGEIWRTHRQDIETQNRELLAALNRPVPGGGAFDDQPVTMLRASLLGSFDRQHGGFGGAPKFPHPSDLAFLLRHPDDSAAQEAALFTLICMAEDGLHDQLGGSFCRYSVDARWEIPHFEKMLYDNGPLLGLYADAWAVSGDAYFRQVAEGIVGWQQREMTDPDGAFYSSLDADSEGEEGRYYVWDPAQLGLLLTSQESALARRHCLNPPAPSCSRRGSNGSGPAATTRS